MKDDMMLGDTPKALKRRRRFKGVQSRGRLWKHSTLADIDGVLTPEEIEQFFCFTLVRNPWDRMVSYYHWLRAQTFDHPATRLAHDMEFENFVCAPQTVAAQKASTARHYMTDAAGTEQADGYFRLEHLEADLGPLRDHLGFLPKLPRINQSDRKRDWRPYYSQKARDSVAEACREDIERFGYSFH